MKKFLLLIICLYTLPLFAQKPVGNSKINGIVLDSTVAKPVDFATIALYDKATNKIVDGATADEKGVFLIEKVAAGDYKIIISFIGYADKTIDKVSVEKGKDVKLGVIRLSTNVTTCAIASERLAPLCRRIGSATCAPSVIVGFRHENGS